MSVRSIKLWIAVLALFVASLATVAYAANSASSSVDITPLLTNLLQLAVLALTVAAGFVGKFVVSWLSSRTKIHDATLEKLLADRINDALVRGIDYAEAEIKAKVADPSSPVKHVKIDNFFVHTAVQYAMRSVPDALGYFGLTPVRVEEMVRSRLNGVMATPAADVGAVAHVLNMSAAPSGATDVVDI